VFDNQRKVRKLAVMPIPFQVALQTLTDKYIEDVTQIARKQAAAMLEQIPFNGSGVKLINSGRGGKRDKATLANTQETFTAFVAKNPGLRIEEINEKLGTTTKDLALPIRKALAAKEIHVEGEKRATRYFPGGSSSKKKSGAKKSAKKSAAKKSTKKRARAKKPAKQVNGHQAQAAEAAAEAAA